MAQNNLQDLNPFVISLEKLTALNMKTLQNISSLYVNGMSFTPEHFMEKNISTFLANGRNVLNYWEEFFNILNNLQVNSSDSEAQAIKKKKEKKLDNRLEDTFPASDAVAKY